MIRIEIQLFIFILFSYSITRISSQACQGKSQYERCSTNPSCGCINTTRSDGHAICGFLGVTCSGLTSCDSRNNICFEPNHICVRNLPCLNQSLCYPLSMSDQQMCPPIPITTTTIATTTVTTTTTITTTPIPIRTTTTTAIPQNCSDGTLLTFDDITTNSLAEIPSDYVGLQWSNFYVMNLTAFPAYDGSGFYNARQSGYIAYNKDGVMMTISVTPPNAFNLYSFIATSGFRNQVRLTMHGTRGTSVEWYGSSYPLYTHWPQLVELNYLNISKITFETDDSNEFAMDNLCISVSPPTAI